MADTPLTAASKARRRQELLDAVVGRLRSRRPVVVIEKPLCAICGSDRIKIDKTLPGYRYAHCVACEAELFVVER